MIFLEQKRPRSFVEGPEGEGVGHKTPGRAWALVRAPVGCAHLEAHLSVKPTPKNRINGETIRNNPRSEVPPPQGLCIHETQSRSRSGTLRRGESSPVAIFIIPAATMMRRE